MRSRSERPVSESRVEYGTGCALLLSVRALDTCGLLDTDFYFYGEDADYCLRIREAGIFADIAVWDWEPMNLRGEVETVSIGVGQHSAEATEKDPTIDDTTLVLISAAAAVAGPRMQALAAISSSARLMGSLPGISASRLYPPTLRSRCGNLSSISSRSRMPTADFSCADSNRRASFL